MSTAFAGSQSQTLRNAFQDAMAHLPTCVTIVSTGTEDGPIGCTANAVLSLFLKPPSLLVSLASTSNTAAGIVRGQGFAVNILSWDQRDLVQRFAQGDPLQRFDNVAYTWSSGQPVLPGTSAEIICTLESCHHLWDHIVMVGRVVRSDHHFERTPLVYHQHRGYPTPTP